MGDHCPAADAGVWDGNQGCQSTGSDWNSRHSAVQTGVGNRDPAPWAGSLGGSGGGSCDFWEVRLSTRAPAQQPRGRWVGRMSASVPASPTCPDVVPGRGMQCLEQGTRVVSEQLEFKPNLVSC